MGAMAAQIPLLLRQSVADWVEADDLGEVVESAVAVRGIGEVGEGSVSPGGRVSWASNA